MRYAMLIRYGPRECDMRYANAICEYPTGRANAICDTRIRYGPRECDMRYANTLRAAQMRYAIREYVNTLRAERMRYANRLRAIYKYAMERANMICDT